MGGLLLSKQNSIMNIFVTDLDPTKAAIALPDRHIVKMGLESCQLLSVVASKWYHNYGRLHKKDKTPYVTEKGAFRNHPCTQWVAASPHNAMWLIEHGIALCEEYTYRYGKIHSCQETLEEALDIFPQGSSSKATPFVRAMPDEYKLDTSIDTCTAYKMYVASKPWVSTNYLRKPERKPDWI